MARRAQRDQARRRALASGSAASRRCASLTLLWTLLGHGDAMDIIWLTASAILIHRLANRIFGRRPYLVSLASFLSGWCCGMLMHTAANLIEVGLAQISAPAGRPGGAGLDTCATVCGVAFGVLLARHRVRLRFEKAAGAPNHA